MPKTSVENTTWSLPASSGRRSSKTLPRDTTISCTLGAEKLPYIAHCRFEREGKVFRVKQKGNYGWRRYERPDRSQLQITVMTQYVPSLQMIYLVSDCTDTF